MKFPLFQRFQTIARQRQLPFYGWAIAFTAMLVAFTSGPGQSYVFSVFVDSILRDTGLSRTELSALYAVGTGVSAAMALIVSRMVDRFGPRRMLIAIALAFGSACFGMAAVSGPLGVLAGFAALRALGQGSLPVTGTLLTVQWFIRYRGRAMAIVGLGFAASNAIFPPVARILIDTFGWRPAYQILGVAIWLLIIPITLLIVRNTPEEMGLHPDGLAQPSEQEHDQTQPDARTKRRAVWRTRQFWLLALPMTAGPFTVTGLVFHQASIFAERGLSPDIAAGVFVAFAAASALMTPLAGFVIERIGPRHMLFINLFILFAALLLLQFIASPLSATLYALLLGGAGGSQSVVGGVIWAHYYGRQGVGAVQGTAALVTISAAALAPLPLAALYQWSGNYTFGLAMLAGIPILCAAILLTARPTVAGARA